MEGTGEKDSERAAEKKFNCCKDTIQLDAGPGGVLVL